MKRLLSITCAISFALAAVAVIAITTFFALNIQRKRKGGDPTRPLEVRECVNFTTVVTAFYLTKTKKASLDAYMRRIENFMRLPCFLHIFIPAELLSKIQELRKDFAEKTYIHVKEFSELHYAGFSDIWREQHAKDPEKRIHVPELYVIWHEKMKFVTQAISKNVFPGSKYFVWCDIGCFRNKSHVPKLLTFPSTNRLQDTDETKMHILQIQNFPGKELLRNIFYTDKKLIPEVMPTKIRLGATILYSGIEGWRRYDEAYENLLWKLYRRGDFIGKDQDIMYVLLRMQPELYTVIPKPPKYFGDPWFFLQYYLSDGFIETR